LPVSNEQCVDQFFHFVNTRNLGRLEELLSDTAEFYFPKTRPLLGKKHIIRFFKILFRQYPELKFQVLRKVVQGDISAIHWVNHGSNKKGDPYSNEGVTLLEMEENRIRWISDFFKNTDKF